MANCLIIYYSYHHGNTEKIAREMAATIGAELCTVDELAGRSLAEFKIIGFGSGIAYGKHYEKLLTAVSGIDVSKKDVFVFSTSGMGKTNYNNTLAESFKNKGANVLGSFACKGFDTFGPFKLIGGVAKGHPDDTDFEASRMFVRSIIQKSKL